MFTNFCAILTLLHMSVFSENVSSKLFQTHAPASGWKLFSQEKAPSRKELIDCFIKDCQTMVGQNSKIPSHCPNNNIVRIATYNIHFWCNPYVPPYNYKTKSCPYSFKDIAANCEKIIEVVRAINADILCLQEVLLYDAQKISRTLKDLGYTFQVFFKQMQCDSSFGIMIVSKYPFVDKPFGKIFEIDTTTPSLPEEKHSFLKATVQLTNGKQVTLYNSHYDWIDETEEIRLGEVVEIIEDMKNGSERNSITMGDFNAIRFSDYQFYSNGNFVWNLLNRDNIKRTRLPVQTKALQQFSLQGFDDCFSKASMQSPKFSVWNGTLVDFMFLNKTWNLPIDGCYVYYSSASDHLPVIMDIRVK